MVTFFTDEIDAMKSFTFKFALCILPCLLAGWVTFAATVKYYRGDSGGFKLGVDLVGGTILVYEIDLRKNQDTDNKFDPVRDINVLAESLKRRIDPNDLYNITIRPAGGEGRIEIILPTGGTHRTKKAEANWIALVDKVEKRFVTPALLSPQEIEQLKFSSEQKAKYSKIDVAFKDAVKDAQDKVRADQRDRDDATDLSDKLQAEAKKVRDDYLPKVEALLTAEQKAWFSEGRPDAGLQLKVGRGKTLELADQVQVMQSEELWQRKLFKSPQGWERLKDAARKYWVHVDTALEKEETQAAPKEGKAKDPGELLVKWNKLPPGDLNQFSEFLLTTLANLDTPAPTTPKVIKIWLKQQAWEEMMTLARQKWTFLDPFKAERDKLQKDLNNDKLSKEQHAEVAEQLKKLNEKTNPFKDDMERISPDKVDQLSSYILTKGSVIGQAALNLINPLVGKNLKKVFDGENDPDIDTIRAFIYDHYGPPAHEIVEQINVFMAEAGQGKDLSVEEVQRIKDLVSKVGSLEFRILANQHDDAKGIADAMAMLNAPREEVKEEMRKAADYGGPPPGPRKGATKEPQVYEITTAKAGDTSRVTYSWVELGPQERRSLNLDNAARTDPSRSSAWHKAAESRDKASTIKEVLGSTDRFMLQGALFYSRKCVDQNLPEEERRKKDIEYFILTRDPEFEKGSEKIRTPKIDGSYLVNAYGRAGDDLRPTVSFTFNNRGGELFGNITRKNVSESSGAEGAAKRSRHLAIILDGMVMSAPTINSEIRTQGQISGNFTQKEVDALVNILRAGRLPATLKPQPVSENTIAATLGEDTIAAGVRAILLAFGAVLAFMVVYYRFAGVVASIALMANLLLTVGFMVAVQATFTLSGLAGIVLTLGMAVDANVLIYERLREERERGASLLQAIRNGYDRALPTIIDTHLSSIFTAIVLYVVGNDNLKGFAISLTVGLIISLFTSLYMTRVLFDFWQERGWLTKLTMMRLFAKPDIDFMSLRAVMFAITFVLAVAGGALFVARLPNDLNIDFVGGTAYGGKLTKGVTIKELRTLVDDEQQQKVLAGVKVDELAEGRRYVLTYPNGDKTPRTVSFSNIPAGKDATERIANVTKRATQLPDTSVELLSNTTQDKEILREIDEGKSRLFTIRTTEKEAELVQACIDQLLREGDTPLLKKVFARVEVFKDADEFGKKHKEARIRFFEDKGKDDKPAFGSQSFVKSLLTRELRREFAQEDQAALPFLFEVNGEGSSNEDGKFGVLKISFPDLKNEDFPKVQKALAATELEFQARPQPDRLENFDSALANETRFRAMWAVLASWAAILLYLWFRFGNWTFGLAAVICLMHDLFFTLGAIAACYFIHGTAIGNFLRIDDFKLDLPSVAALLTLVGYSVNDTIVVFDRIREVRGKNPDLTIKMLNDSINQTLSRTILASLTVWLVVFVLYLIGGPGVHLFAFVMVVGVIVGTYSSIYIASPLLLWFGEGRQDEPVAPQGARAPANVPVPETGIKPA